MSLTLKLYTSVGLSQEYSWFIKSLLMKKNEYLENKTRNRETKCVRIIYSQMIFDSGQKKI